MDEDPEVGHTVVGEVRDVCRGGGTWYYGSTGSRGTDGSVEGYICLRTCDVAGVDEGLYGSGAPRL